MPDANAYLGRLEAKVAEQLKAQRPGYLLGAGSSFLSGQGYPLAIQLWDRIKDRIEQTDKRAEIQAKLDAGAQGIEQALDLLDDGNPDGGEHRLLVTEAIAGLFCTLSPPLEQHASFIARLSGRSLPALKVFSLNYDPLIERAAEHACVGLCDGFAGHEHAYFAPAMFDERIGFIRGTHRGKQFDETRKPVHLLKLHGSLGWYECRTRGIRRCGFSAAIPAATRRLMVPPQRRKANDTMTHPYAALWSAFRGSLGQSAAPINRLISIGYGFADEHVNAVIEAALARSNFTLLIFTKALSDVAWARWSTKHSVIIVTEDRSSLKGETGPGHGDLWSFERLAGEV